MSHFLELRQRLADCRTTLRTVRDAHEETRAACEQAAIEDGRASGKNAEERARSLTLALTHDPTYQASLCQLRRAEAEQERVEALLEAAIDERRASEWQIRARLADALLGAGIPSESSDPNGDGAFDDTLLYSLDAQAALAARR